MMPDETGQVAWPEAPAAEATEPAAPEVPVADQRAAGVAPEDTVTLADQRAGTPPPELPDPSAGAEPTTEPAEDLNPLHATQSASNESATLPVNATSAAAVAHGVLAHVRAIADEALRELERVLPWHAIEQGHGKAGEVIRRNQP